MDILFGMLIWSLMIAGFTPLSPAGWIITGITAIIPILTWRLARVDTDTVHHRPATWELWLNFVAPIILIALVGVVAFIFSIRTYGEIRSILRPIILLFWGLELLLLWRHRHNVLAAWICITFVCWWIYGVAVTSTCSFTMVCEPIFWGPL